MCMIVQDLVVKFNGAAVKEMTLALVLAAYSRQPLALSARQVRFPMTSDLSLKRVTRF